MRRPRIPVLLAGAFVAGVLATSAGSLADDGGTRAYFSDTVTVTLHITTGPRAPARPESTTHRQEPEPRTSNGTSETTRQR